MSSSKDQNIEYEVEAILQRCYSQNEKVLYLVKWKGWSKAYSTWEPLQNLLGCPYVQEMLLNFDKTEDAKGKKWGESIESSEKQLRQKMRNQAKMKVTYALEKEQYPFIKKKRERAKGGDYIKILRIQKGAQNQSYCCLQNGQKIPIEWAHILAPEKLLKVYESMC